MEFQEFWRRLASEIQHQEKYRTLKRSQEFEAKIIDPRTITVKPGSQTIREIPIDQFQSMWNIMKDDVRNQRYINTNQRYYSFWSSSYISALIDHVVSDQNME